MLFDIDQSDLHRGDKGRHVGFVDRCGSGCLSDVRGRWSVLYHELVHPRIEGHSRLDPQLAPGSWSGSDALGWITKLTRGTRSADQVGR